MYEKCSNSLAEHAAAVFRTMTGHCPTRVEVTSGSFNSPRHHYNLGERVNFVGQEARGAKVTGYFICAFETMAAALAFARDIASYLGLSAADAIGEADSYVGEFLNVVIGLTCSAWADHGLRVEFFPPEKLKEHAIDRQPDAGYRFQVAIRCEGRYQATLFLYFAPDSGR